MAASAHLLLSTPAKRTDDPEETGPSKRRSAPALSAVPSPSPALDDCTSFSAEGACAELPLTSEPPLADAAPLTSEPPLADAAPLTSEPTSTGTAAGMDPDTAGA